MKVIMIFKWNNVTIEIKLLRLIIIFIHCQFKEVVMIDDDFTFFKTISF